MLSALGVILNLGILIYLGFQSSSCMGQEYVDALNLWQNPYILSFVGVVALFIALKN